MTKRSYIFLSSAVCTMVQYRQKTSNDFFDWTSIEVSGSETTIMRLRANQTYEYRVGAICPNMREPIFSDIGYVRLPAYNAERLANCGNAPVIDRENRTPIEQLRPGDVVMIGGDFPMTVLEAMPLGDGWFSGRGYTTITWVFGIDIAVRFDRLRVNTDLQQIGGRVISEYDPTAAQIVDINQIFQGGAHTTEGSIIFETYRVNFIIPPVPTMRYNPETGELTIIDAMGTPQTLIIPRNNGESVFPIIVESACGTRFKVEMPDDAPTNADGTITPTVTRIRDLEGGFDRTRKDESSGVVVRFERGSGRFGFDDGSVFREIGCLNIRNRHYLRWGTDYVAPWKLIPVGESDVVEATITAGNTDPNNMYFVLECGTGVPARKDNDRWILTLPSVEHNEHSAIFAVYRRDGRNMPVGRLNVVSYRHQHHTITLVEVDAQVPLNEQQIEQELNAIYNQFGVSFSVRIERDFSGNMEWDEDQDGRLNISGSRFFTTETSEMRALRRAFQNTDIYRHGQYYIFILSQANAEGEPSESVMGDMPRGQHFGFAFMNNVPANQLPWLIAHEVGHGIFTLRHTFYSQYQIEQGSTDNLMDYTQGRDLGAFQWNVMSNPAEITRFDSEEEGRAWGTIVINRRHTDLFNHVFRNNLNPFNTTNTDDFRTNDWDRAWTYIDNPQETIDNVISILRNAVVGEIVPEIALSEQGIHIGRYRVGGVEYAVAIYSRRANTSNIRKVSVAELSELSAPNISKHLRCYENIFFDRSKYILLAFFEEGEDEPVLMIQVARNELFTSFLRESFLEKWMQYLGVLDRLQIFSGNERVMENSFVQITSEPRMPEIRVRPIGITGEMELRLEIRYQRDGVTNANAPILYLRNDISRYPANGWHTVGANEEWTIDFGQDIRGGTAYLFSRYEDRTDIMRFYIRGTNPTANEIRTYLEQRGLLTRYWFFMRMMRQESSMRQFGQGTQHSSARLTGNRNAAGEPLYGPPRGFGLMQLDNWGTEANPQFATEQHLWDWRANIAGGVEVLDEFWREVEGWRRQHNTAIAEWNREHQNDLVSDSLKIMEGAGAGTTVLTITEGRETFAVNPTIGQRCIYDAAWIRRFNGGRYLRIGRDSRGRPRREIFRVNPLGRNYVHDVCNHPD